ncbi:CaiB/BaiF CoA-transferase family protein [Amycolatopsis mongoliensis]|uniref:CaiB/BaiF CoA-transferase family protein n=1 Tax=Amycolatopsis mongoliensis TaxID=715475 RepID=A0A9Y2JQL7_9PSEU|nr:CaiB/BaiF CoA-transferase family protein [Amycolatopsis sp. 4-36]WIY01189.1 CaiB/BaiF CoA-transferase family protein [Amycolatopsis sp. 4-36]
MKPLQILRDVKIVAFTQFLLGPASVQYLSDLGADVIKVEQPGRGAYERSWSGGNTYVEEVSAFFLLSHRNVRSVTIDLKSPEGQRAALRLAASADVVVDNFRPGVLDRLGVGYEKLSELRPDLIYACGSGYGSDSPYRDLPGQDLLLQAMTGLAAATGRAGDPPTPAGAAVVDQHAAALLAMGILAALHHRQRTGEGQRVEATMVQAALDLQLEPVVYHLNGGLVERPAEPLGSSFHEAPYGVYETADEFIALSLSPVAKISAALGDPAELREFLDPAVKFSRREQIRRALGPLLLDRSAKELLALFREHGIWCAPVNDYDAVFADPVVTHLDPVLEFEHPRAGKVKMLKHPVRFSSGEPELRTPPPELGEHTDAVLSELGYSAEKIAELREAGVV